MKMHLSKRLKADTSMEQVLMYLKKNRYLLIRFCDVQRIFLSPHMAWYSQSSGPRLVEWGITDAFTFVTKQKIDNGLFATGPF
ncbi:MAG: hypothetical protein WDO06_01600 [Actinomycetota bacterium]